ncbi:MAG: GTP 3',8-cyclase MoaA [Clostridia bacterium]|nr:GTP 3',8-cyclase MoaA [Clostridia bacterium]
MKDRFGREITYLRVSVTRRCNLNCVYCGKADCEKKETELAPAVIERLVRAFVACGIRKVRITGGEPLVRADVCEIIARLRAIDGVETLALTTNGVLLAQSAAALKQAGLDSVNISLDSTDGSTYRHLTGADVLERVLAGIEAAQTVGLFPIKVNAVLMKGVNSDGAGALIDLAKTRSIDVRFIELMPFSDAGETASLLVTGAELLRRFPFLTPIESEAGTAKYYTGPGFLGRVGLINPITEKFCADCSRIRLLADGRVKPCLGDETVYDLTPYLDDAPALQREAARCILQKPAGHQFESRAAAHGLNETGG